MENKRPDPINGYLDGTGKSLYSARADHTHEGLVSGGDYAPKEHQHKAKDITDLKTHVVPVTISVADWASGTSVTKTIEGVTAAGPFAFIVDPADASKATEKSFAYSARSDGTVTFSSSETPDAPIKLIALM